MKKLFEISMAVLLGLAHASAWGGDAGHAVAPADVKNQLDGYLFDAARRGDTAMLAEFVSSGYDLDRADYKGYTALILAAYNGHKAAVTQLLAAGANPCAEDKRGNTASSSRVKW